MAKKYHINFSKIQTSKNKITCAHRYNLSVHDFQTVFLNTQDFWIVQVMAHWRLTNDW